MPSARHCGGSREVAKTRSTKTPSTPVAANEPPCHTLTSNFRSLGFPSPSVPGVPMARIKQSASDRLKGNRTNLRGGGLQPRLTVGAYSNKPRSALVEAAGS